MNFVGGAPLFVRHQGLPAPGLRDYGNGLLRVVGNHGFNWASSASGNNGYYLGFHYGGVGPNDNSNRAYGLPLRCLQE